MVATNIYIVDATQGNIQLTTHFNSKEFRCKDNSNIIFVGVELLEILEDIREHFNKPVIINSGYRTIEYNKKIGGVANSKHCAGIASDIKINGIAPKEIYSYLDSKYNSKYGIGLYNTFVHIDTRENKARWNNSK